MKKAALLILIFLAPIYFGHAQNFTVEHIQSDAIRSEIHRDSSMDVTESIVYDFGQEDKHGIYRDIRLRGADGTKGKLQISDVRVTDENGIPYKFTKKSSGGNLNIKIGDPDFLINGIHTYVISYKVKNAIGYFDDHDEIYWNATGNDWSIPIQNATAEINLPPPPPPPPPPEKPPPPLPLP